MSIGGGINAAVGANVRAVLGALNPTGADAQFATQGDLGIWEDWFIRNTYPSDYHRYALPLTSPGGFQGATCAFVQLAAPTSMWVCDWSCEYRTNPGDYPKYPDPRPTDQNIVILDIKLIPDMVLLGADGTSPIYRISGTYVYGYRDPLKAALYHGRPPWMTQKIPRAVVDSMKTRGIVAEKY